MPKYRKLYAKVCESLDVQDMPDDFTRLLWVLLPLALDREGRGLDSGAWLKAKLFPLREDVTPAMVAAGLAWCCARGMAARYRVAGRAYFWVPTFERYQGDTSRESESEYPAPPIEEVPPSEESTPRAAVAESVESDSRPTREQVMTYSRPTPEPVVSRSCSEADPSAAADADSEAHAVAEAAAPARAQAATPPATGVPRPPEPIMELVRRTFDRSSINGETPRIIGEMVERYGETRLRQAIQEMDVQAPRKRGWAYVCAILSRWQETDPDAEPQAPPGADAGRPGDTLANALGKRLVVGPDGKALKVWKVG
jgi:hypothetical protein